MCLSFYFLLFLTLSLGLCLSLSLSLSHSHSSLSSLIFLSSLISFLIQNTCECFSVCGQVSIFWLLELFYSLPVFLTSSQFSFFQSVITIHKSSCLNVKLSKSPSHILSSLSNVLMLQNGAALECQRSKEERGRRICYNQCLTALSLLSPTPCGLEPCFLHLIARLQFRIYPVADSSLYTFESVQ